MSDGSLFSIKVVYLPFDFVSEICANSLPKEISVEEENALRFASECLRTEQAAARLVANAEQNRFELSHKLESRGYSTACIRDSIRHLVEVGLVNDERYARLWLESRLVRKADSPQSLLVGLCRHGIERSTANSVLKTVLNLENELLLLKKYFAKNRLASNPSRQKKLKYEGFSSDVIRVFEESGEKT